MVDLLSRHLYSGPQVYLRELIQNAVDAVTARRERDPEAPDRIRLTPGRSAAGTPTLEVTDTGVGLTSDEARELLATIGRSSKRDADFGAGRAEFIGAVRDRNARRVYGGGSDLRDSPLRDPGAHPIRWEGHANGTFRVTELPEATDMPVGTTVQLSARRDTGHWLGHDTVLALSRDYGALLPFDIAVRTELDGEELWQRISAPELPWRIEHVSTKTRARALAEYCEQTFRVHAPRSHRP